MLNVYKHDTTFIYIRGLEEGDIIIKKIVPKVGKELVLKRKIIK